jgi:hypothetical protein
LSLQIIRAIRQEASKAVIQTSLMNEDFYFKNNTVKFTVQDVRAVCNVKGLVIV